MVILHAAPSLVTAQNITTPKQVSTLTVPADSNVEVALHLTSLGTLGAECNVSVQIKDASTNIVDTYSDVFLKWSSFSPRFLILLDRTFVVPNGFTIEVWVSSNSGSDTSASIATYFIDPNTTTKLGTPVLITTGTDPGELDTSNGRVKVDDLYHADINVAVDGVVPQDEYTVPWFKNGARITSDITDPKVTVVNRSSEALLLDAEDLDEIAGTGILKLDEPGDRIAAGNAYVAIVTATIDGATRTFSKVVSRDAAASLSFLSSLDRRHASTCRRPSNASPRLQSRSAARARNSCGIYSSTLRGILGETLMLPSLLLPMLSDDARLSHPSWKPVAPPRGMLPARLLPMLLEESTEMYPCTYRTAEDLFGESLATVDDFKDLIERFKIIIEHKESVPPSLFAYLDEDKSGEVDAMDMLYWVDKKLKENKVSNGGGLDYENRLSEMGWARPSPTI